MEEQRQRQEDEQRRAQANSVADAPVDAGIAGTTSAAETAEPHSEEAMLQRALALSTETPVKRERPVRSNIHLLIFLSLHTLQILKMIFLIIYLMDFFSIFFSIG